MRRNRIRRWLRRHGIYTGRVGHLRFYPERNDLPELPRPNELAVAGTAEHPKWALLDCPCGYGHTILLPLSGPHAPLWSLSVSNGLPSISPSIDRQDSRRCHYFLRDGKILWA
jgi:Family of unknown function (DUF6527)